MATNAEDAVDDSKEVTEDDLRALKYDSADVETSQEEDETEETDEDASDESDETGEEVETDDQTEAEESDEETETPQFVKEFPYIKGDTPDEYARNLELAYKNSTAEALRLKGLVDAGTKTEDGEKEEETTYLDPNALYIKQLREAESASAFSEITKRYPSQVNDRVEYDKFVHTVGVLSSTIFQSEKRLASSTELFSKAAVILGWKPEDEVDEKDKLGNAIKDRAATTKTSSTTKPKAKQSKVTDQQVAVARATWANSSMTDTQIREELEAYV